MNVLSTACRWLLVLVVAPLVLAGEGCKKQASSHGPDGSHQEARWTRRNDLFTYALANLNQLEEYGTPEMLKQTVDRFNQWVQDQPAPKDWKADPMVAQLPKEYADLPELKVLDRREFHAAEPTFDGEALQLAVVLRDASTWARGDQVEDIPRAKELFDWTVRNIQLLPETVDAEGKPARVLQTPWETLLLGRGSASERAWVFVLLARNQGLDAVVLEPAEKGDAAPAELGPCLVGVLSKGELYLFDTMLGLPIPAPEGKKLAEDGQLTVEPATLSQVAADDSLLRQLDADIEHPYALKASQLKSVVALVAASPAELSQRMRVLESHLAGSDRLVLTADPTAQAGRLKACANVNDVRLWPRPYETLLQQTQLGAQRAKWQMLMMMPFQMSVGTTPVLFKGRMYHLKGHLTGRPCAAEFYQMARVSNRELQAANMSPEALAVYMRVKLDASYWLGLIAAHQKNAPSAIDYFETRTLDVVPDSLWAHGAKYNLARVFEATARVAEAIKLYRDDTESPSYHGNVLRARWLESLLAKPAPKAEAEEAEAEGG